MVSKADPTKLQNLYMGWPNSQIYDVCINNEQRWACSLIKKAENPIQHITNVSFGDIIYFHLP